MVIFLNIIVHTHTHTHTKDLECQPSELQRGHRSEMGKAIQNEASVETWPTAACKQTPPFGLWGGCFYLVWQSTVRCDKKIRGV